jgi:hypothetical protein
MNPYIEERWLYNNHYGEGLKYLIVEKERINCNVKIVINQNNIVFKFIYINSSIGGNLMIRNVSLYLLAGLIIYFTFGKVGKSTDLFNLISLAGIFATFGSALLGTTVIFEQKCERRVLENVEIFFKDIVKSKHWKRWGFLNRQKTITLLNNNKRTMILRNPKLPYDVGTHKIEINLPTVVEDFFDLPIFKDYFLMRKFDKSFHTLAYREIEEGKVLEEEKGDNILSYECVKDILKHACIYRIATYVRHFSIAVIIFSISLVFFFA